MNKKIVYISLIFFILGIFLRVYKIQTLPPHLSNDEISIAFDAYSIRLTGADEYGYKYPLSFKSQGTYKAPAYSYILSVILNYTKNTDFAARLPSILAGLFSVVIIGLLTFEISNNFNLSMLSSAIMSVTPWHVIYSKMVMEANIGLLFYLFGLYAFFKASNNSQFKWSIIISSISMALSVYSYHSYWLYTPFTVIMLSIIYLNKNKKILLLYILLFFTLITPIVGNYINNINTSRASSQVLWKDAGIQKQLVNEKSNLKKGTLIFNAFVSNYFTYTNPGYLFFDGLGLFPKNNPFEIGLLLWPTILSFIYGLIYLKSTIDKRHHIFMIVLIVTSPFVVSITSGGSGFRNLTTLIPYIIVISIGFYKILHIGKTIPFLYVLLLMFSTLNFTILYFFHSPYEQASTYQGYKPIAQYIKTANYKKAILEYHFGKNNIYIGVPHYYFGYYNEINPTFFQNRISKDGITTYDRLSITNIDWNNIAIHKDYLYIVPVDNKPTSGIIDNLKLEKEFVDYNGMPAFELYRGMTTNE